MTETTIKGYEVDKESVRKVYQSVGLEHIEYQMISTEAVQIDGMAQGKRGLKRRQKHIFARARHKATYGSRRQCSNLGCAVSAGAEKEGKHS